METIRNIRNIRNIIITISSTIMLSVFIPLNILAVYFIDGSFGGTMGWIIAWIFLYGSMGYRGIIEQHRKIIERQEKIILRLLNLVKSWKEITRRIK